MWDGTINYSASLKSYELLGQELGYSLVGCDFSGANAFFVRDNILGDHFAAPFTAENHYEPDRMGLCELRPFHSKALLDRTRPRVHTGTGAT